MSCYWYIIMINWYVSKPKPPEVGEQFSPTLFVLGKFIIMNI